MQDSYFKKCVNTLVLFFMVISLLVAPVSALGSVDSTITTAVGTSANDSGKFGKVTPLYSSELNNKEEKISVLAVPVIPTITGTSAVEDHAYSYDVDATDTEHATLNYSISSTPAATGLDINTTSGLIEWGYNDITIGVYNITVTVDDLVGNSTNQTYTLTVSPWLEIVDVDATIEGIPYNNLAEGTIIQNISHGAPVSLAVTLRNNGNGMYEVIGFVNVNGTLAIQGQTPQPDNDNTLGIGAGNTRTFTLDNFVIPPTALLGLANLSLYAEGYDTWIGHHDDTFNFQINVTTEILEAILENATLDDNNLTCTKTTNLRFNITNVGQYPILWYNIKKV